MSELNKQEAFSYIWKNDDSKQAVVAEGFHCMRNWQNLAFETLKDSSHMILNAPTGSGKSWMICLLSAFKMIQDLSLRTLIVVPQSIIATGFIKANMQMPSGDKIVWKIKHNLCDDELNEQRNARYLLKWLLNDFHADLGDKTAICTHATLVLLHKELIALNQLELLENLLIWIDEAHHVHLDETSYNALGAFVSHLLSLKSRNIKLGLATASFFRGDHRSLLASGMELLFTRFNLAYDEHLKNMTHLKSLRMDFVLCGFDYLAAIKSIIQSRKGKDIIYIPHPISNYSTGNKQQEVKEIIESYGNTVHAATIPLISVTGKLGEYKILDLVSIKQRKEKKSFLSDSIIKEDRAALDAIVAMGMFKEGADWIWADRIIIVGARSSLVDMLQMIGRLFRDAEGKEHVEIVQLLPFGLDQHDEESFKENLDNYLKAIFASLILEHVINPMNIQGPRLQKDEDVRRDGDAVNISKDLLLEAVPDLAQQQAIWTDFIDCLTEIREQNEEKFTDVTLLRNKYNKVMPKLLEEKYGITQHAEEIAIELWNRVARRKLMQDGVLIEDIDFYLLQKTNPLDCILRYTTGVCNIKTFEQFREAMQLHKAENERRWKLNYEIVCKYVDTHGNCKISKNYKVIIDGISHNIGSWFSDQKKNFFALSKYKQDQLSELPGFIAKKFIRNTNLSIDQWIDMFITVSVKMQTPLIPNSYVYNGFNIGAWMQHIRKDDEWSNLKEDQQRRLLDNNFKLSPATEKEEAAILALAQFVQREGALLPEWRHREEIFHKGIRYLVPLSNWFNKIKNNSCKLSNDGQNLLMKHEQTLRLLPVVKDDDASYLQKGFLLYQAIKESAGRIIISSDDVIDGFNLLQWQNKIRSRRTLGESFRLQLLNLNPYFFSEHRVQVFFQDIHPRIEKYIVENGDAVIPQQYVCKDGYLLGEKISDLRERKNKLPLFIRSYLDSLGNKWAWNRFEHMHLQNMQTIIAYLDLHEYSEQSLPSDICALRLKIIKAMNKYSSSESYVKRIEELAPGFFIIEMM